MISSSKPPSKATICFPPEPPSIIGKTVFLAGSIEMGTAIDWHSTVTNQLSHLPVTILNPLRTDWDSTWVQDISNPLFRGQVEWELDCQDRASAIAMYFDRNGKAPISLLELGLNASSGKMVVCCPEGFWCRGNVQVVCARFGIKLVETVEELVVEVVKKLGVE